MCPFRDLDVHLAMHNSALDCAELYLHSDIWSCVLRPAPLCSAQLRPARLAQTSSPRPASLCIALHRSASRHCTSPPPCARSCSLSRIIPDFHFTAVFAHVLKGSLSSDDERVSHPQQFVSSPARPCTCAAVYGERATPAIIGNHHSTTIEQPPL